MNPTPYVQQWQPIETAPKDGSWVLIAGPSGYTTTPLRVEVARYYPAYRPLNPWQTHSNDAFTDGGEAATHWSPLPLSRDTLAASTSADAARELEESVVQIHAALTIGLLRHAQTGTFRSEWFEEAKQLAEDALTRYHQSLPPTGEPEISTSYGHKDALHDLLGQIRTMKARADRYFEEATPGSEEADKHLRISSVLKELGRLGEAFKERAAVTESL